jgi:small ligand-binding sensory domain FIST
MALGLALAQLEPQVAGRSGLTLGWIYLTDHYTGAAEAVLERLRERFPGVAWVGGVGVGVSGSGVEYFDEPALTLMLGDVPRDQFKLFSGLRPLSGFSAQTALVHADAGTPDLGELIVELAERTDAGYVFGGLTAARTRALHMADGVFEGGLSGVAFGAGVGIVSRVTQGSQPVGPARRITEAEQNVVVSLDNEPALECLLQDLQLDAARPREVLPRLRNTLVGLTDAGETAVTRPGQFGTDVRVRHLVGIDPGRRGVAIADRAQVGAQLAFCTRNVEAARRDLVRICTEIREEVEPETQPLEQALQGRGSDPGHPAHTMPGIAGAVYVSCAGRGGPHFGAPSAELAIVKHALGDVPLVGFFAGGEIAHHHLYGYTGVLTVFTHQR